MSETPYKRALVQALGCKVNQAEAEAMARALEARGYVVDPFGGQSPDLIVVNTCCVTSRAEGKSRRMAHSLSEKFPGAPLVIAGCLAEVNPGGFDRITGEKYLLGSASKGRFDVLADKLCGKCVARPTGPDSLPETACGGEQVGRRRSREFLKVQDGCSQRCSYCIVPRARGPSRSLSPSIALDRAREIASAGAAEIVVSGIHLGAYGRDLTPRATLADLLESLLAACPRTRFRLSSIEPPEISSQLVSMVAGSANLCRHFHIPLQSGDDEVLARMRRPYNAEMISALVDSIRSAIPSVCIGMDVMVGFPGESSESFGRTLDLIQRLAPAYLHVFPFSPRPATPAASFEPRVSANAIRERVRRLRSLSAKLRTAFCERFVGKTMDVVAETKVNTGDGALVTRSDNYLLIKVIPPKGRAERRRFPVLVDQMRNGELWGSAVD
jgi:threonylcarbamoyladenosine tRNA methylthiotransferase MtaB